MHQYSINSSGETDKRHRYYLALFLICLGINIYYCLIGFNHFILDRHSFRQTQTALSAYYILKDGFKIAYETPILGHPWIIPFEFPLYQWIVVFFKMHSSFSLDACGRIVSLSFFYLSLIPVYQMLKRFAGNPYRAFFILCFILVNPIYIFWSRTFMIESTALFFSSCFAWQSIEFVYKQKGLNIMLALIFGILGALVKITTLIPFIAFIGILVLIRLLKREISHQNLRQYIRYLFPLGIVCLSPIIAIKCWISFSDNLKHANLYAYNITSAHSLGSWNFGTLNQKLSPMVWAKIFFNSGIHNTLVISIIFSLLLLASFLIIFIKKFPFYRTILVLLALYLTAPVIFTNLHFIHTYYTYANSIFLCAAIGFACLSFLNNPKRIFNNFGLFFSIFTLFFLLYSYQYVYHKYQRTNNTDLVNTCNFVKGITKEKEVILVYGNDWGSEYAYYSGRKTIALRNVFSSIQDTTFRSLMALHTNYTISTLVLVLKKPEDKDIAYNERFLEELIQTFGFHLIKKQKDAYVFKR